MKKIVLMLAVAAFGTGAMAQTAKPAKAAPAQTQTAPAKTGVAAKPAETQKTNVVSKDGEKSKKSHKHIAKAPKAAETK